MDKPRLTRTLEKLGIVFGTGHDPAASIDLPAGAIRARLRVRPKAFTKLFIRFPDRVEEHYAGFKDDRWFPALLNAVNRTAQS